MRKTFLSPSFVLILCIQFIGIKCKLDERLRDDFFHIYKNTAIEIKDIKNEPVTPDKVNFFLFTKSKPNSTIQINQSNSTILDKNTKTVFLIHGWTSSREADWYDDLKNAFLNRKEEYQVIQVDWSKPANELYTVSSISTKDVGQIVGDFLLDLHINKSVPLNNFLLVGHSLGGQVSGYVGKKVFERTGKKLPRIIALDPAGPLFIHRLKEEKLNKDDAEVVEVVHTDVYTFGYPNSCGTIDFWPNGGNFQPGCTRIDLLDLSSVTEPVMCDHHRSHAYFIEAVLNPQEFVAQKCSNWAKFKTSLCEKEEVALGDLTTTKTGDFYFSTNKEPPYAKKSEGGGISKILKVLQ